MRLVINNQDVPLVGGVITDSLRQYYSVFEMVLPARINQDTFIVEQDSERTEVVVVKRSFVNKTYQYTCIPVETNRVLNTTFEAFEGTCTVKQLLARVGIKNSIQCDSAPSYWRIPRCKFMTLIKYLESYANFNHGGCPRFYLDVGGALQCYDLASAYTFGNPKMLQTDVTSDSYTREWCLQTPGEVNLVTYSKSGRSEKKLVFEKGFGSGSVYINETTGHEQQLAEQSLHNDFYLCYYMSRTLRIPLAKENPPLGSLVSINGRGKFIVTGRTMEVKQGEGQAVEVTYILNSPYEDS